MPAKLPPAALAGVALLMLLAAAVALVLLPQQAPTPPTAEQPLPPPVAETPPPAPVLDAGAALPALSADDEHTVEPAKIAIIIDDIGDQWLAGKRSAELAGQITLALLPFSPYSQAVAALADQQGKEVMLHAPMEPQAHHSWKAGLETHMDEPTIRTELRAMLASVPTAKGVNNHMGSALTQRDDTMSWVMDELRQRGLYFVDSRTSARSRALVQAQRVALASAKRDIFLDNVRAPAAIELQFQKLLTKARMNGSAIAIGHPYPETLAFLEVALPGLALSGVQLVPVSALLKPAKNAPPQHKSIDHIPAHAPSPAD